MRRTGYIGLGSNLGDRWSCLRDGLSRMRERDLEIVACSSVWESEPLGCSSPLWFLTAQSGPDKVHLAINQSRRRADGTEYNSFPTLWIFTRVGGRWGVQFRSSFLAEPVQPVGDVSE